MDLREIEWSSIDGINLEQDKYQWRTPVNTVMTHWIQLNGKFLRR
jgi:hypothetical protein